MHMALHISISPYVEEFNRSMDSSFTGWHGLYYILSDCALALLIYKIVIYIFKISNSFHYYNEYLNVICIFFLE